jgi:hypothetical protein
MLFLGPLVYFLAVTFALAVIFHKTFQELILFSFFGSVIFLYCFGLFNQLGSGLVALLVTCFGLIIYAPISLRKRNWSEYHIGVFRKLFTPGLFIFLVLYIILFFLNFNKSFWTWDDLKHWGPMVKEMIRLDNFYDVPQSLSVIHQDYPPAIQIIEYLFCKLSGHFSEAACFNGLDLFILAPLISIAPRKFDTNSILKIFSFNSILFILPVILNVNWGFYSAISQDIPQAIIGGFALFQILSSQYFQNPTSFSQINKMKFINLGLTLSILALIKPTGLFYVGICFLTILTSYTIRFIFQLVTQSHLTLPKFRLAPIIIGLLPFFSYFTWRCRTMVNSTSGQGSLNLSSIIKVILGDVKPWQTETSSNFIAKLFNDAMFRFTIPDPIHGLRYFELRYFELSVLFLLLALSISFFFLNKIQTIGLLSGIILATVLNSCMMWILYQTQFPEHEAIGLYSYERYIPSVFSSLSTLSILLILQIFCAEEQITPKFFSKYRETFTPNSQVLIIIIVSIILFTPQSRLNSLIPPQTNNGYHGTQSAGKLITTHTPTLSNVYIFSSNKERHDMIAVDYQIFQHNNTNVWDREKPLGKPMVSDTSNEGDLLDIISSQAITPEALPKLFSETGAEYIFFIDYSEDFYHDYAAVFKSLQPYSLYKIMPNQTFEFIAADQS